MEKKRIASKFGQPPGTRSPQLPSPFKCSKCDFVGNNKAEFNNHWSLEH